MENNFIEEFNDALEQFNNSQQDYEEDQSGVVFNALLFPQDDD